MRTTHFQTTRSLIHDYLPNGQTHVNYAATHSNSQKLKMPVTLMRHGQTLQISIDYQEAMPSCDEFLHFSPLCIPWNHHR